MHVFRRTTGRKVVFLLSLLYSNPTHLYLNVSCLWSLIAPSGGTFRKTLSFVLRPWCGAMCFRHVKLIILVPLLSANGWNTCLRFPFRKHSSGFGGFFPKGLFFWEWNGKRLCVGDEKASDSYSYDCGSSTPVCSATGSQRTRQAGMLHPRPPRPPNTRVWLVGWLPPCASSFTSFWDNPMLSGFLG